MIPQEQKILIVKHCSEFLNETHLPLTRFLNRQEQFAKVKVRHKSIDEAGKLFNSAFPQFNMLYERSTWLNNSTNSNYYVFPVNGYKYVYSKEINNFLEEYQKIVSTLTHEITENSAKQIISDLIRFNYVNNNITEGIHSNCEIVVYNIPFYYAINKNCAPDYESLLHFLRR